MRIASFTLNVSLPGGIEKICVLLAEHWARAGNESDIISFTGGAGSFFPATEKVSMKYLGIKKKNIGLIGFLSANMQRITKLRALLKNERYDIMVCHGPIPLIMGGIAALGLKIKMISYPHMVVDPGRNCVMKILQYIGFFFAKYIVLQARADKIFIPLFLRSRIIVIPNLTEINASSYLQNVRKQKVFLAVGNLRPAKNYAALIKAFAISGMSDCGWKLKIAGDGDMFSMNKLNNDARCYKVENSVFLLGAIRNVSNLYEEASVFVNSSNVEGMSIATIDALLYGVPIVATDCSNGQRELVIDNKNGFLMPTGAIDSIADALRRLAEDDALRGSMSRAALKHSELFLPFYVYSLWDSLICPSKAGNLNE